MKNCDLRDCALKIAAMLPEAREDAMTVLSLVEDLLDWAESSAPVQPNEASASAKALAKANGRPDNSPR